MKIAVFEGYRGSYGDAVTVDTSPAAPPASSSTKLLVGLSLLALTFFIFGNRR